MLLRRPESVSPPDTEHDSADATQEHLEITPSACEASSGEEHKTAESQKLSDASEAESRIAEEFTDEPISVTSKTSRGSEDSPFDDEVTRATLLSTISIMRRRIATLTDQLHAEDIEVAKVTKSEKKGADKLLASLSLPLLAEDYPLESAAKKNKSKYVRDPRIYDLAMDDPKFLAEKVEIEAVLSYKFNDLLGIREAMYTHKTHSARLENGIVLTRANYCLAMYGDAVLRMVLLDCWWDETGSDKVRVIGDVLNTRLKTFITDDNLRNVAEELGISALIGKRYPWGIERTPGKKDYPTTVEALIGAVYLDSGRDFEVVRELISSLLKVELHASHVRKPTVDEEALSLTDQLDRGESVDIGTARRLVVGVTWQTIKEATKKAKRMVGRVVGEFRRKG